MGGTVESGYELVQRAFETSFTDCYEEPDRNVGAALAIYREGRPVVDLWGGNADAAGTRPWTRDTLANIWSGTKGVFALAAARLAEIGRLDYDAPVKEYWRDFGNEDKEGTTVAHLLSHRAGLPGFSQATSVEDLFDWRARCGSLARQRPCWEPGTVPSYHAVTWGYLVGEVLRAASGGDPRTCLQEHLAGSLKADVHIGVPGDAGSRIADLIAPKRDLPPDPDRWVPSTCAAMAIVNPLIPPEAANQAAWRAATIPAANGHASAHGLARVYGAVANDGRLDGTSLWSIDTIQRLMTIQSDRTDEFDGKPATYGLGVSGYALVDGLPPMVFGHFGWGGSYGIWIPAAKAGIGYVVNQMSADPRRNPAFRNLLVAILLSLGIIRQASELAPTWSLQAGPLTRF